jgi:hypothetical protein
MRRKLTTAASLLLLVVCLGLLGTWAYSLAAPPITVIRCRVPEVNGDWASQNWFSLDGGRFIWSQLVMSPYTARFRRTGVWWERERRNHDHVRPAGRLGFYYESGQDGTSPWRFVTAPCWAFAAPFAVMPMWVAARRYALRRRKRAGRCVVCGYDLRASPDRCPECGRPATATAATR